MADPSGIASDTRRYRHFPHPAATLDAAAPPAWPWRWWVGLAACGTVTEPTCDGQAAAAGPIRSLAGIERLSVLNELDAPHNEIRDLAPLASLSPLGTLTLTDNAVQDLSPLEGLELFDLGLPQNPVRDLTPLAGTTTGSRRCSSSTSSATRSPRSAGWPTPRSSSSCSWG